MAFKVTRSSDRMESEAVSAADDLTAGTHIGKSMKIKGNFSSDEDVTIQGIVSGKLKVGQTLIIGEHGKVDADIKANTVIILGGVKGNITASQKVEIRTRGRFEGNLKSDVLVVEEGALLIGDVNKEEK